VAVAPPARQWKRAEDGWAGQARGQSRPRRRWCEEEVAAGAPRHGATLPRHHGGKPDHQGGGTVAGG
jgi:hypothetical protein